jgi:hypothetical protein
MPGALLAAAAFFLIDPALLLATSGLLRAVGHQRAPLSLAGLWKELRGSERARVLVTFSITAMPGSLGFVALDRLVRSTAMSIRGNLALLVIALVANFFLSLAAYRALHLIFAGNAPRSELAFGKKPPVSRTLLPLILALGALVLAWLSLSALYGVELQPDYFEPLQTFLWPALVKTMVTFNHTDPSHQAAWPNMPVFFPLAMVLLTSGLGYATSVFFYRLRSEAPGPRFLSQANRGRILKAIEADLYVNAVVTFLVVVPIERLSVLWRRVVHPLFSEGIIKRVPIWIMGTARALLWSLHNGSSHRAMAFVMLGLLVVLVYWVGH